MAAAGMPAQRANKLLRMNDPARQGDQGGIGDALRAAIDRTLTATAPAAAVTRERAAELVDEIARRGHEAREELARRGHGAGAELARRGQDARDELGRRGQGAQAELARQLERLEARLASIEELLGGASTKSTPADEDTDPQPQG